MKYLILLLISTLPQLVFSQTPPADGVRTFTGQEQQSKAIPEKTTLVEPDSTIANPRYDAELAKKLGADEYGMKSFTLVLLKTGTNHTTDKAFISESFRGHLENINRLADEGKLIVAGPLGRNDKTYRGIFILNVTDEAEADKILQTDPAIKSGLLGFELYEWFGSAALSEYLDASDRVWKIKPL